MFGFVRIQGKPDSVAGKRRLSNHNNPLLSKSPRISFANRSVTHASPTDTDDTEPTTAGMLPKTGSSKTANRKAHVPPKVRTKSLSALCSWLGRIRKRTISFHCCCQRYLYLKLYFDLEIHEWYSLIFGCRNDKAGSCRGLIDKARLKYPSFYDAELGNTDTCSFI